jgi:RNA polymerase sigma factor for flagellar operon FliA
MDMLPRSVRTKQRKLSRAVESLEQRLGRAPTDDEVRSELQLDNKGYEKLRSQTKPLQMIFLDRASSDDDCDPHEFIADESIESSPEHAERAELHELVAHKILELPGAQRKVLALYFHEGLRLAEIGEVMGLSEARVSQIRTQALSHLRKFVRRMTA